MFVFNIVIDEIKMAIPCRTYQVSTGAWEGYLQLIDVQNMQDDMLPDHKVSTLYIPISNVNWFAHLRKNEPQEIEPEETELEFEEDSEESEEELPKPSVAPQQKRRYKKSRK